jgi:hypothetical protein
MFIIYYRLVVRAVSTELMEELCGGGGGYNYVQLFLLADARGKRPVGRIRQMEQYCYI